RCVRRTLDLAGTGRAAVVDDSRWQALPDAAWSCVSRGCTLRDHGTRGERAESHEPPVRLPGGVPGLLDADVVDERAYRPTLRRGHPADPGPSHRSGHHRA